MISLPSLLECQLRWYDVERQAFEGQYGERLPVGTSKSPKLVGERLSCQPLWLIKEAEGSPL